jgi:rRNA maturation RNase YbeY
VNNPFECESVPSDLIQSLDPSLLDELAELCCFALAHESVDGKWSVTLAFTTDAHMTELHESFMNLPGTTDIITFPFDDEPGGDIAISVAQADRQRIVDGWDLEDELRFLVVHGALHLAGWDDSTPQERAAMLQRQREITAAFHDASLRSR